MGIMDRAFGADKNTMLFRTLALHWRMVASNYRNHLKDNEVSSEDNELGHKVVALGEKMAELANDSVKGFGITSPDSNQFQEIMGQLLSLEKKITFTTDKPLWLNECVSVTNEIIRGNKRPYQQRNVWFSRL